MWCYSSWEAALQGNTDHSVQEQDMGQTNKRCESKHALVLRLFHTPLLFCPSLHPSRHSPLSPLLFNPTADDATASRPDGSDTRVLPEPHGSHRCRANAANGSFQCQRSGGYSHDTILRYKLKGTHMQQLMDTTSGTNTDAHMQDFHFSLLPKNIFIICKNYRCSTNIFIQLPSGFALVTLFKMF